MSSGNDFWAPGPVPRPVLPLPVEVSQSELQRFTQLQQVVREFDRLRKSIRDRITGGAEIQAGPLTASVKEHYAKRFNRKTLVQILGEEYVQQIQSELEPTVSLRLVITNQSTHPVI